jgi:hypothetical protein
MKCKSKALAVVFSVLFLSGCSLLPQIREKDALTAGPAGPKAPAHGPQVDLRIPLNPAFIRQGRVFGKTEFTGLLKTAYVRLTIIDKSVPEHYIYFYVGSKKNLNILPWGSGAVIEPGYFVLNLKPGAYRIIQLAIPVGTTLAEEDIALDFEVQAGRVFYVGTLSVEGTRERVKFGGVPVLKPGFKYNLAVKDEFRTARQEAPEYLLFSWMNFQKKLLLIVAQGE